MKQISSGKSLAGNLKALVKIQVAIFFQVARAQVFTVNRTLNSKQRLWS
jgi:hypothetical protein